ncbi:MAG: hypothetical protein HUU20_25905 [Pirellulales bacterium]|nr:hypothetical protein [Pirellulales bacterium]
MRYLLRFAGSYNVLAGLSMILFYHEGYKLLGVPKPHLVLEIQMVGILVALFGVGYHIVAANPVENRNLLMLGFWAKSLCSAAAMYHVWLEKLPWAFVPVVIVSDVAYLPFFYIILRRLDAAARRSS